MINKLLVFAITASVFFSCQESEEFDAIAADAGGGLEVVSDVSLSSTIEEFVNANFVGELIVDANALVGSNGVEAYDALLSSELNLIFDTEGALVDFAEDSTSVSCSKGRKHGKKGGKGKHHDGDSTSTSERIEITLEELPVASQEYITANYPDSTVLKLISKVDEDAVTIYKVLIANVGALIFDADGAFVELYERGGGSCSSFEEVAIEDLPEAITTYLSENYPDVEVIKARTGTVDEVTQIYVSLADTGVLIFDEEGTFIELKECGMKRG